MRRRLPSSLILLARFGGRHDVIQVDERGPFTPRSSVRGHPEEQMPDSLRDVG